MKKTFITGLLLIIPLALTLWIIKILFDFFSDPLISVIAPFFTFLDREIGHPFFLSFVAKITSILLLGLSILIVGIVSEHLFHKTFYHWMNKYLEKVPFIKNIYKISKDFIIEATQQKKSPFESPSVILFPFKKTYSIAFHLTEIPKEIAKEKRNLKGYYLPTAPHIFHGLILFSEEGKPIEETVESILRFCLSCGMAIDRSDN